MNFILHRSVPTEARNVRSKFIRTATDATSTMTSTQEPAQPSAIRKPNGAAASVSRERSDLNASAKQIGAAVAPHKPHFHRLNVSAALPRAYVTLKSSQNPGKNDNVISLAASGSIHDAGQWAASTALQSASAPVINMPPANIQSAKVRRVRNKMPTARITAHTALATGSHDAKLIARTCGQIRAPGSGGCSNELVEMARLQQAMMLGFPLSIKRSSTCREFERRIPMLDARPLYHRACVALPRRRAYRLLRSRIGH